jgi:tripartite ATP-independent transporter DctP family solute receptor
MLSRPSRHPLPLLLFAVIALVCPLKAETYTLKLGHVQSSEEPIHKSFLRFAKGVEDRSEGRVLVHVYEASALGTNKEVYELARLGASVIANVDSGYLSDYLPDVGILTGPYLLQDINDYKKVVESAWYREQMDNLYEKGFKVIALNGYFGARHIISAKPIRNVDDFAGLQIRIPPNIIWVQTFRSLGANPTTLAWSEVYSGLAQGVVDAAEAPLGSIIGSRLYEHQKVLSTTGHFRPFVGMVMGRRYWEKLPEDIRSILLEEGESWGDVLTGLTVSAEQSQRYFIESQGVRIAEDIDYASLREATRSVYSANPDWSPGLYEKIQGILEQ